MSTKTPPFGMSTAGKNIGDTIYAKLLEVYASVHEMKSDLNNHCKNEESRFKIIDTRLNTIENDQKVLKNWRSRAIWTGAILGGASGVIGLVVLVLKHFKF
jgi:hypothetical protein